MSTFRITSTTTRMDQNGKVSFTVTNTSGANLRGRASIKTDDGVSPDAFDISPPRECDFAVDSTHEFAVTFKKPKDAPAGDHKFQMWVVDPRLSDEIGNPSNWIGYTILEEKTKPFPILWLIIPAAVLVVAAIGVGTWWYFNVGPGHHVVPPLKKVGNVQVVHRDPTEFGTVQVNSSSPSSVIQLHNSGTKDTNVTAALAGTDTGEFHIAVNSCTCTPLAVNQDCEVHVAFTPSSEGVKSAQVHFSVDSGYVQTENIMSGTAQGVSAVCFSPQPLSLYIYYTSPPLTTVAPAPVTITNCGTAQLTIHGATFVGDSFSLMRFTITNNQCTNQTLQPHVGTCQIWVGFNAPFDGHWTVTLNVFDDAANSPHQVPVEGTRKYSPCLPRYCIKYVPPAL